MKVVLVGAGNLATNLGKALFRAGHEIVQVYSRTDESACALAEVLKCAYTTDLAAVPTSADVFIFALADDAVERIACLLRKGREEQLFVHTAGSLHLDVLPTARRGVFYPMQSFSKDKEVDFSIIPCFVESFLKKDLELLLALARTVSDTVYELSSNDRKYLHLAAVFCNNFANHCFALGAHLLKEHGNLPFSVMLPLIDETASKLHVMSPHEAQTGPAKRRDKRVLEKHRMLLATKPEMGKIYELFSDSIYYDQLRLKEDTCGIF